MANPKNNHDPHPLHEHTEESKVADLSKISEKDLLRNAELEKEQGFKEGLANNSNNEPPSMQQK